MYTVDIFNWKCVGSGPEPEFVNDQGAQELIPRNRFRQSVYVAWLPGASNRVVVPARKAGNRFMLSLKKVYNFGHNSALIWPDCPFNIPKIISGNDGEGNVDLEVQYLLPSRSYTSGHGTMLYKLLQFHLSIFRIKYLSGLCFCLSVSL
jgi:hypothetical protein